MFLRSLLTLVTGLWLVQELVVGVHSMCRTLAKSRQGEVLEVRSRQGEVLKVRSREGEVLDVSSQQEVMVVEEEDAVRAVMKKVDNRNLRKLSRMLSVVPVEELAVPEQEVEQEVAQVLRSVESRSLRKISRSLQGVDVSRVLSHFRALGEGRTQMQYSKSKHVTVHEAEEEDESFSETDPLSSSDTSSESERSFPTSSLIYSNIHHVNNNILEVNRNAMDDPDSPLKSEHEFVKFAESTELLEVLHLFQQIRNNLGVDQQAKSLKGVFPELKKGLRGKVPNRWMTIT